MIENMQPRVNGARTPRLDNVTDELCREIFALTIVETAMAVDNF